jgi:hypothetical protein
MMAAIQICIDKISIISESLILLDDAKALFLETRN